MINKTLITPRKTKYINKISKYQVCQPKHQVRQPKYQVRQPKIYTVLQRGNFCRKFSHFFDVLFAGQKVWWRTIKDKYQVCKGSTYFVKRTINKKKHFFMKFMSTRVKYVWKYVFCRKSAYKWGEHFYHNMIWLIAKIPSTLFCCEAIFVANLRTFLAYFLEAKKYGGVPKRTNIRYADHTPFDFNTKE